MQIDIPNYIISKIIYDVEESLVVSAQELATGKPVIIKFLKIDYPTPDKIARFKREYALTKMLRSENIITVYDLIKYKNSYAIVMEDFYGDSLEHILKKRKLSLDEFLNVSLSIVQAIEYIHANSIIHKNITDANIIWNPKTNTVKLIDFGISTTLSRENPEIRHPNLLEGTLAYLSPEQTGRMNRGIDYRTDFYSLGVTFYKMLTGRLPFESEDAMELVHFHIAKQAKSPNQINHLTPPILSDIVMKLLAKNAEDRYQTTYSLKADLTECLRQLKQTGKINAFSIAARDISDRLRIPEKLYGREAEIQSLLQSFSYVEQGQRQLILVAGYAGVGKSALVQEVHKVMKRGYFIAGKYDQFKQNEPYIALVQAFDDFVQQILMGSKLQLERWKIVLQQKLGPNGNVITEMFPAFELIIGPQPKAKPLEPIESQNRFNWVFLDFMLGLASAEHPLTFFLDDLQWADPSSLKLLELMLTHAPIHHLMIIGAYRDNEVDQTHSLMMMLDDLVKAKFDYKTLLLKPLDLAQVSTLLMDTLHATKQSLSALAELCYAKTQGNPFFLGQLLQTLYQDGLIYFETHYGVWNFNIAAIRNVSITNNVVDLMTKKIHKLKPTTQTILHLAACFGFNFDLNTLAIVYKKPPKQTIDDLWEALQESLIVPDDDRYKFVTERTNLTTVHVRFHFLHDRVQQASYALIDEAERQATHYHIGRLLLANTAEKDLEESVFSIVNQLNAGAQLITSEPETLQFVKLNLLAGKKAKANVAFKAAVNYLKLAKAKLSNNAWFAHYHLTYDLMKNMSEALFTVGKFDQAEEINNYILENATSISEKANIQSMQVIQYMTAGKRDEALAAGLKALRLFNINISKVPSNLRILAEILLVKWQIGRRPISSIINDPICADPQVKSLLDLLNNFATVAYITNHQNLLAYLTLKVANLNLRHGLSPEAAVSYEGLSTIWGQELKDLKKGYQFGKLGLAINEKLNDWRFKASVLCIYTMFCHHWNQSWKTIQDYANKVIVAGLQSGDLIFTAWACYAATSWDPETHQEQIITEGNKYLELILQTKHHDAWDEAKITLQFRANLLGKTLGRYSLSDAEFNEQECFARMKAKQNHSGVTSYFVLVAMQRFYFEDYVSSLENIKEADKNSQSLMGLPTMVDLSLFSFLAIAALYPQSSAKDQSFYLKRLNKEIHQMKKWADHCPVNFLHKYLLMTAEFARLFGTSAQAENYYDQAILAAERHGFLNIEALANELAAKFYLSQGKEKFARGYMTDAHYAYIKWGANAKASFLEELYPQLLTKSVNKTKSITQPITTTMTLLSGSAELDLSTVLKASQTISGEIIFANLLQKMMRIVIENAGAEKGFLLLEKNDQWFVEAKATSDQETIEILHEYSAAILPATIINSVINTKKPIVINDIKHSDLLYKDSYLEKHQPKSILCTPLLNHGNLSGLLYLENNLTTNAFTHDRLAILSLLATQIAVSLDNAKLYDDTLKLNKTLIDLNKSYERFVPREFLSILGKKSIMDVAIGDQTQEDMTAFFCDIRNFTTLSENMTPQESFVFITDFLSHMEPNISAYNGFIDKYLGDGIMALYRNADDAVQSAIAILNALRQYNDNRLSQGQPAIRIGIGLNSGLMTLGTVGGKNRMDGTVISDSVNVASRVEQLSKVYGAPFLITEETYLRLRDTSKYALRKMDMASIVKGKSKPIGIYEVFDTDTRMVKQLKIKTRKDFELAISLCQQKQFVKALSVLVKILDVNKSDLPANYYYQLCIEKINNLHLPDNHLNDVDDNIENVISSDRDGDNHRR